MTVLTRRFPRPFQSSFIAQSLKSLALILVMCGGIAQGVSAETGSSDPTLKSFVDPPISARPGAFWNWLNGNVDRERLKYELQQMKEKGMSGAEIWDVAAVHNGESIPAGPEFLGPESAATIRFALAEGRKLGLRMGMITSSGWNAGGTWVDPSWASKILVSSSIVSTGPIIMEYEVPLPKLPKGCPVDKDGKPLFLLNVAVLAVPESPDKTIASIDKVVDLTPLVDANGTIHWDTPNGVWRIIRFACINTGQILIVPSPKSAGLFIDFLDPDATRRHLQEIMNRLEITPANASESGLNYLEVDSMELHEGNPWTDKFPQWFQKYAGYDLRRWLPVLAGWTIQDKDTSKRFEYDYRKVVSDLLIHSHYETGSEFLKDYGIEFVGEAGGPGPPVWDTCPVDALKALGNVDVPRGEFWIQHRNMFLIKEIASASHTYGKPIVDAESFTTWRRWEDSPFVLKMSADRAFAEGLNRLTIHGFAHSPESAGLPGRTYHAGIDINPNTTWWPYARPFMDYLARCSYMLQLGRPVADVLWYYGDKAPNFFPEIHNVPEKPRLPGLGRGYDYDVVNSDVILNRLKVQNGRLVLPEKTSYAVLAFPEDVTMPLAVMEKIESLVKQGAVVAGVPPKQVPGLHDHKARSKKLQEIASRVWGDNPGAKPHTYGKGRAYGQVKLDDVLAQEGIVPDFQVETLAENPHIDYIHRTTDNCEIYFVRNEKPTAEFINVRFRDGIPRPKIWDTTTGAIRPAMYNALKKETGRDAYVDVILEFDPGGTLIVVLDNSEAPLLADRIDDDVNGLRPSSPWTVSFPEGWGAPTSVTLTALKSWTDSETTGIRYFSGTAEYRNEIHAREDWIREPGRKFIDLGEVYDVAELEINGQTAGIAWKPPYRFDVTGKLVGGTNSMVVRVTNQWHNRLVGDSRTTVTERLCRTNQPLPGEKAEPLKSGLLGPIEIIIERLLD